MAYDDDIPALSTRPDVYRRLGRYVPYGGVFSIPRDRSVEISPLVIEITLPDFVIQRPVAAGVTIAGGKKVRPLSAQLKVRPRR